MEKAAILELNEQEKALLKVLTDEWARNLVFLEKKCHKIKNAFNAIPTVIDCG